MDNELFVQGTHRRAMEALGELRPFHFPIAFPEVFLRERAGFDVILGNPPWEKARVEEHSFWTRYFPGFGALSAEQRASLVESLRKSRPDLVQQYERERLESEAIRRVLVSGAYPGMGTGDPDLYKAFCWRFARLTCNQGGRIGVVLPRSAFSSKGSAEFRKQLFQIASVEDLVYVINTGGWVFDNAERRYTIGLTSVSKRAAASPGVVRLRGPFASLAAFRNGVTHPPVQFSLDAVQGWTDTAALPLLPAEASASVFAQLRKAPRLDQNDDKSWRVRPYRELDATNDKNLMKLVEEGPQGHWPVFKAEAFDIWEPDRGTYYAWADPERVTEHLQKKRSRSRANRRSAFFEFTDSGWFRDEKTLPCFRPRIAFHDVARNTDTRTVKVALVPGNVFLCHLAPFFLWPRGDEQDEAFLLGVLSSVPLDWYARRFVELHLTYDVLNPFPIPRPGRDNPLWQRTVALAGRLACPDKRFAKWAKAVGVECGKLDAAEKDDMIAELDAVVAHLYGLTEPQLVHIFETFHEGWDYQSRLKAVLAHYKAWAGKA